MEKKLFILNHGFKKGHLTYDCILRIQAAKEIALSEPRMQIIFVGGHGIDGAKTMRKYWQKNFHLTNHIEILERSNNTAQNIEEIKDFLLTHVDAEKVTLISNSYHLPRIKAISKKMNLKVKFIDAEAILKKNPELANIVRKYQKSFSYKVKVLIEKIALFYVFFEPRQKIIGVWRKFIRN